MKPGKSVIKSANIDFVSEETGKVWGYFPVKDTQENEIPPTVQAQGQILGTQAQALEDALDSTNSIHIFSNEISDYDSILVIHMKL